MKERLLAWLACPECGAGLTLSAAAREGNEILEGTLACGGCRGAWPIRGGVPRFVQLDRYADSFSFEWTVFHDVQIDVLNATNLSETTLREKTGLGPEDFRGRLALDAGVGAGRFAEVVSRWGGEVVGVDLSFAVDAAYATCGRRENVHIVQADIFRLPLRRGAFDHVYSIGVLHHTPDTRAAFESLVPLVAPGGTLSVYLYPKGPYALFSDLWRRATVHLPLRLSWALAAAAIPLYHLYRLPLLGRALRPLFPISMDPRARWRWLDTFDWYTPRYQWKHTYPEVFGWFKKHGFTEIEIFEHPVCVRGRRAAASAGGGIQQAPLRPDAARTASR